MKSLTSLPKRTSYRISGQLYDPIGLLGSISLKTKLVFREACLLELPWDGVLPADLQLKLIESLEDRSKMEAATFHFG